MNDANARWIGIFVTFGLAAIVGLIVVFGGLSFRSEPVRVVAFFDQSVNGLNNGSMVKFRGVPIGSVERIMLRMENQRPDSTAIPVIIAIDRARLERDLGVADDVVSPERLEAFFGRGLVARLNLESFITGQLFVELDFSTRTSGVPHLLGQAGDLVEIPTVLSPIEQITEDIVEFIAQIQDIDFKEISSQVSRLIGNSADAIEAVDFAKLSDQASAIATRVREILGDSANETGLAKVFETAEKIGAAADEARLLLSNIRENGFPIGEDLGRLLGKMEVTVGAFGDLAAEGGSILHPESELRVEFDQSMREVIRAARSLRQLVEYLERNPGSFLSGRERRTFQPSPPPDP